MLGLGLGLPQYLMRGRRRWTPAALFARGQSLVFDFVDGHYATKSLTDGSIDYSTTPEDLMAVQRASTKWVYDSSGTLVEVPVDTLAIQHDPVTGESQGALIEESRTNLLLWNEELNDSVWTKNILSSSYDTETAPDGSTTADVFEPGNFGVYQNASVSPESEYVFSLWVKLIGASAHYFGVYDRTNGNWIIDANGYTSDAVVGKWKRVFVSFTTPPGCEKIGCYACRGTVDTGSQAVWRPQLEEGTSPSSSILTTDAPVTRAADNVTRVLGKEFNPREGTLFAEFYPGIENKNNREVIFGVSDGTVNNRTLLRYNYGHQRRIQFLSVRAGVISSRQVTNVLVPGASKVALSYYQSGWTLAVNGHTMRLSDVTGDVVATTAHLSNAPGSAQGNHSTGTAHYYPYAMTEAELIDLTS